MQLAILIVTYNNEKQIEKCLKSIPKQKNIRIYVIDNCSKDKTLNIVKKHFSQTQIIALDNNLGYGIANNIGINFVLKQKFDYVLILNPDVILFPDTIENLLKTAKKYQNQGIFGPKIYIDKTCQKIWSRGGKIDQKRYTAGLHGYKENDIFLGDEKCDFISGTAMLIPRKLLHMGLRFAPLYFLYYEDVEFCVAALKKCFPSYLVSQAKIIHFEESNKNLKNIKNYYLARNHLLFVERNAPFRVKLREVVRLPKTIWQHWKNHDNWSLKGIGHYWQRKFYQNL